MLFVCVSLMVGHIKIDNILVFKCTQNKLINYVHCAQAHQVILKVILLVDLSICLQSVENNNGNLVKIQVHEINCALT